MSAQTEPQTELFPIAEISGYSVLNRKERLFAQALFEGATQREAARTAGYAGDDAVLDVAGSRLVRSAKIQALMNQAWQKAGASIDGTLAQAAQLQKMAFKEAIEATSPQKRREAFHQWLDASKLIAAIHGKINAVHVSGQLNVAHEHTITLPDTALPVLAQIRREVLVARNGGAN